MRARFAVPVLVAVPALFGILAGCEPGRSTAPAVSFDEIPAPAEPPAGGDIAGACPGKFGTAIKVKITLYDLVGRDPADDNGDKVVCSLITKDPVIDEAGNLVRKGTIVQIDNNIPASKLGKCPVSFSAAAVYEAVEDKNGNSVVCRKQTEDFGTAVVDDNDA
jgi:hypothetical protein